MKNTENTWPTPEFARRPREQLAKLLGTLGVKNQIEITHNPEGEMSEVFHSILTAGYPDKAEYQPITVTNESGISIAAADEVILLPVTGFVSAPDFVNWQDGRRDNPKNGASSKQLMKSYSKRSGDTAPPIQQVVVFHSTDNEGTDQYRFGLYGDGAHRLGAAMQRGDKYIRVGGGVSLMEVEKLI